MVTCPYCKNEVDSLVTHIPISHGEQLFREFGMSNNKCIHFCYYLDTDKECELDKCKMVQDALKRLK